MRHAAFLHTATSCSLDDKTLQVPPSPSPKTISLSLSLCWGRPRMFKFKPSMLFASENSGSRLSYKRLLLHERSYTTLSGHTVVLVTLRWSQKLTMFSHHRNWHGPMAFSSKPFRLALSLSEWRSAFEFEYCAQVFPQVVFITLKMVPRLIAHPVILTGSQVLLFFHCFDCHDSKISKLGVVNFVMWSAIRHFVAARS